MAGETRTLAEFASALRYEDIPAPVIAITKACSLTVPPHGSVIVNHELSDDKRYEHEHIGVAVKDAFAAARRQLDDLA